MDFSVIITRMVILLLLIAVGFVAAKRGVFPAGSNRVLSQLVICIANPCMVLFSVLGSERQLSNRQVYLLTAIAVAMYVVLILLGLLLPRLLRCPEKDLRLYRFMCIFSNMGFLGFPVVEAVYGANAVFYAAIFNLVFQFVVYTYGVELLAPSGSRFSLKRLTTPMIPASLLAYLFYLTNVRAPAFITGALEMLGSVSSAVCMLVIGIALSAVPLREVFTNWRLYVICLIRQLLLPLAVYALLHPFVANELILGVTVLMASMPIAALSTLLTAKYGGNERLAASGVFLSTLLSLAAVPLLLWLLFG